MGVVADGDDRARDLIGRARELRVAAGIPIGAMADQVGVTKSTISVWERNPGKVDLGRFPAGREAPRRWLAVLAVLDATSGGGR
jgi:DNA-binding XRE family transcriptional regulator